MPPTTVGQPDRTQAWHELIGKPLLRGYLHAAGAITAVVVGTLLILAARPDVPKQITVGVFVGSSVLLFGASALYHIGHWGPAVKSVLRRIDHANIYILIAGTYTPVAYNLLGGALRPVVLISIWAVAIAGVTLVTRSVHLPDGAVAAIYIGMGWLGIATAPGIVAAVGAGGLLLVVGGGVFYSMGAAAYAWKRPRLWSRVFSYHEVFHLCTLLASALFFTFIATQVLPHTRP
ncbi:MAG TPA: hemolysin III family protein [Candidatus Angelobacter sp.]|jgi:hemolysin III|nr:hemolysin III family protein [Candidatus Angelobacter sp.]